SFQARKTADALFAGLRGGAIHRLLVRTALHAFAIATAAFLVDEHDAVFGALVDGLARARAQTARISAVIADAGQGEEPDAMFRKLRRAPVHASPSRAASGGVLVDVGMTPFGVGGQIAQGGLWALRADAPFGSLENGLALEYAIRAALFIHLGGVPN